MNTSILSVADLALIKRKCFESKKDILVNKKTGLRNLVDAEYNATVTVLDEQTRNYMEVADGWGVATTNFVMKQCNELRALITNLPNFTATAFTQKCKKPCSNTTILKEYGILKDGKIVFMSPGIFTKSSLVISEYILHRTENLIDGSTLFVVESSKGKTTRTKIAVVDSKSTTKTNIIGEKMEVKIDSMKIVSFELECPIVLSPESAENQYSLQLTIEM